MISPEIRAIVRPRATFRELPRDGAGAALLLRRAALFAFVMGCGVAAGAAGRFTPRLILDGALSFAFVPVCQILGLAVVFRVARTPTLSFARAVDLFFAGAGAWLLWFVGITVIAGVVPPRQIGPWLLPVLFATLLPLAWSLWIDFHYFREVMDRSAAGAVKDVVLHRAIAWGGAFAYFVGPSIANDPLRGLRQWTGGI